MDFTRRVFVSGALAASFLTTLSGEAEAVPGVPLDPAFTVLDGLSELRFTDLALQRLRSLGITVYAVAPATVITGADGVTVEGISMQPEYGTFALSPDGRPSKAAGRGQGGVGLRSGQASMEIADIRGDLTDNKVHAFLKVNDQWLGELPLYTGDPSQVRLALSPGAPNQPSTIKGTNIPVTPTQEALDAFEKAFGSSLFTTQDTVFTASGQGHAWPLPASPVS
jgi:hypothetical protein